MDVEEIKHFSPAVLDILRKLLPQLSKSAAVPTEVLVRKIIDSNASRLLVAKEDGMVLGMLTIVIFPIPTGVRAWIEDVVVDEAGRGKGVGELLSKSAIHLARDVGARTVDLTSRPTRVAANRLYGRIGFEPRETNVYRFEIDS